MSFFVDAIRKTPEGESRARRIGEYWTYGEAVAAAKRVIDTFLFHEYRQGAGHGISAKHLLATYRRSGEAPLVWRNSGMSTDVSRFDHLEYATTRCAEICRDDKDE